MNNILKQKGFTPVTAVIVISVIVGVFVAAVYFYKQGISPVTVAKPETTQTTQTTGSEAITPVIPEINNDKDLEVISLDLEKTDLNQLDSQLDLLSIE